MVMNRYTQSQLSGSLHSRRREFRVQETSTFDHCRCMWCMWMHDHNQMHAMEKFMLGHRIKRQGWEWTVSSDQENICLRI